MMQNGTGGDVDNRASTLNSEMACKEGIFKACFNLGVIYLRNQRGDDDLVKARGYFDQACKGGVPQACTFFGYMWETGEGGSQDFNTAKTLYRQGCDGGDANGCAAMSME